MQRTLTAAILVTAWAAAMIFGTGMFIATGLKSAVYALSIGPLHIPAAYQAVLALLLNIILAVILTPIFEAVGARRGQDQTVPGDYEEELAPKETAEVGREALG